MGGDVPEPDRESSAGARDGAAGHGDRARRIGAGGERGQRGIAENDGDLGYRQTENLGANLRERGFHPLSVRMHADADFQPSVGREAHRRLLMARNEGIARRREQRRAVRRHLDEVGKADADEPAIVTAFVGTHLIDLDPSHGELQAAAIIAAVIELAGWIAVRHGICGDEILAPHLPGLAADHAGDGVDRKLHGEADAGARHATIRHNGRFVGRYRRGSGAVGVEGIRPGQMSAGHRRLEARREWPHRIGPGIDNDVGLEPENFAARIGMGGDDVAVLAAIGAGDQMLAPVLDPAERPAIGRGEPGDAEFFGLQNAFVAECAADIGSDDANLRLGEAKMLGHCRADHVRDSCVEV